MKYIYLQKLDNGLYRFQMIRTTKGAINRFDTLRQTKICNSVINKSSCSFGERCDYAHGLNDLIPYTVRNINTYKVSPCKNFIEKGCCNNGMLCAAFHNESLIEILNKKYTEKEILNSYNSHFNIENQEISPTRNLHFIYPENSEISIIWSPKNTI